MKAATVALLAGAAGCSDPVVQMQLRISPEAEGFEVTCLTTVELYTDGGGFPGNSDDYEFSQAKLDTAPATYNDLSNAIRGKFDVAIPTSGLSAIEMYGWAGDSGFNNPAIPPDLLFYGVEPYIGQDTMQLTVVPNVSCKKQQMKVRPIDILKLTTSLAADTAGKCAAAAVADTAPNAGVSFGTLSAPDADTTDYWGGLSGATLSAGAATVIGEHRRRRVVPRVQRRHGDEYSVVLVGRQGRVRARRRDGSGRGRFGDLASHRSPSRTRTSSPARSSWACGKTTCVRSRSAARRSRSRTPTMASSPASAA